MKHRFFLAIALIAMTLLNTGCNDQAVAPTQLPANIQAFVQQNFPGQSITFAQKDLELFGFKYDVFLADGTQIEFDTDDVWDKIERQGQGVPMTLVPQNIATHVQTNFPGTFIAKIDKDTFGYEVELSNGLELKFNKQGIVTEIDD